MQYCSSQHQTLLSPPDTLTIEHCFRFGPAASFFLPALGTEYQKKLIDLLGRKNKADSQEKPKSRRKMPDAPEYPVWAFPEASYLLT